MGIEGTYRGIIVDIDDSTRVYDGLGAVKVYVPQLHGKDVKKEDLPWASLCLPGWFDKNSFGSYGFFSLPELNSHVWVIFENGNLDLPVVIGGYTYYKNKRTTVDTPHTYETIGFSDGSSKEGQWVLIKKNESIELQSDSGTSVKINGNNGIEVKSISDDISVRTIDGSINLRYGGSPSTAIFYDINDTTSKVIRFNLKGSPESTDGYSVSASGSPSSGYTFNVTSPSDTETLGPFFFGKYIKEGSPSITNFRSNIVKISIINPSVDGITPGSKTFRIVGLQNIIMQCEDSEPTPDSREIFSIRADKLSIRAKEITILSENDLKMSGSSLSASGNKVTGFGNKYS